QTLAGLVVGPLYSFLYVRIAESGIWKFVLVSMRSRAWKSTTSHSRCRARGRCRSRKQRLQAFGVGLASDAALGDDGGNVAVRRDVERRMPDLDVLRRDRHAGQVGDFGRSALLDRDLVPRPNTHIKGRERRGDVERNAVFAGQHRERVGPDLVGHIA